MADVERLSGTGARSATFLGSFTLRLRRKSQYLQVVAAVAAVVAVVRVELAIPDRVER